MGNNKYKILIVEDEANIRSFIKANLETSDYQVLCAETCELGMMMYASHHPDLILLDLGLPDRDGMSLIQEVRETDTVPIIVLSARSNERDKVEALDLGANDYITKPFSATYLKIRIKSLLHQRKELQEIYWKAWSEKLNNTQETTLEEKLTPSQPQIISYDEQFMQQVMQVLEEQMENSELTVDEFAQLLNLGRSVF